jgi:hypothetical protein
MEFSIKNWQAEVENLRASKEMYDLLNTQIKIAIRNANDKEILRLSQLLIFTTGIIVENSLYQIINSHLFPDDSREAVYAASSLQEKWEVLLDEAVMNEYHTTIDQLDFSVKNMFQELKRYISKEIKFLYETRNKIAHGQLERGFNNTRTELNSDQTKTVKTLNYFQIVSIKRSFDQISNLLLYAIDSPIAFKRDFDTYYRAYENIKIRFAKEKYPAYVKELQQRHANRKRYFLQNHLQP